MGRLAPTNAGVESAVDTSALKLNGLKDRLLEEFGTASLRLLEGSAVEVTTGPMAAHQEE